MNKMPYNYKAYGLPLISEIELPALVLNNDAKNSVNPISVRVGKVPETLTSAPLETKPFTTFNENELKYQIDKIGKYYIANGTEIIIEPLSKNWDEVLLYFYSNCLAAALFQRNIIPFHVSGVFIEPKKVILFAAPSRTGKSTTSLMLQQKGYKPFTDDTAILKVKNKKCYAQASYPMIRLWQNTIEKQSKFGEHEKQQIYAEINKFGFAFHEEFNAEEVEVAGIVFLEEAGSDIKIEKLTAAKCMQNLGNNIYRIQWLAGMNKQNLQFMQLTQFANILPAWTATRPKGIDSFDSFSEAIISQIIKCDE